MALTHRPATADDLPRLAAMNRRLIEDERNRNPMTLAQLEERMAQRLAADFRATLFERDGAPVAYALYRQEPGHVHLQHFFVERDHRGQGVGRAAIALLMAEVWPPTVRLTLDVLATNPSAHAFWRALGFQDYAVTMEMEAHHRPLRNSS